MKKKMKIYNFDSEPSEVKKLRDLHLSKGFDLVDITQHVELKINCHGSCNGINEPNDNIYHIKAFYRDCNIATFGGGKPYPLDSDKFVIYTEKECNECEDIDFIIFMRVQNARPKKNKKNTK